MSGRNDVQDGSYSKAFTNFVETSDDVEGLLAYALYKRTINERRSLGRPVSDGQRDPQKHEIEIYRTQAARYLETFGATVIEAERANIIAEGVQESTSELIRRLDVISREIKSSTGFWWPGVVVGVVAWLISIVLTILTRIIHRTARNRPRPPNTWARDFIAKNFIKQPIRIVVNDINGLALTAHFS